MAAKAEARIAARAARRALPRFGAAEALAARFPFVLTGPGLVAGYWPLGSEIDPRPLLERLAHAGARLALPYVPTADGFAELRAWRPGDPLAPDAFGLLAPRPHGAELVGAPRAILCPLLAFDRAGGRLGQGGGHYDRLLARLKPQGCVAIGLAFAGQEIAAVPMEPHDQRLDWIVTEEEAIEARPSHPLTADGF